MVVTRTAVATDDLRLCWPMLGTMRWNRQQVIVAVDDDADERLLGAILVFDGGHDFIFVAEFAVLDAVRRKLVAGKLLNALMAYAHRRGAVQLLFHSKDPRFVAQAVKLGGQPLGPTQLMTMPVRSAFWESHFVADAVEEVTA